MSSYPDLSGSKPSTRIKSRSKFRLTWRNSGPYICSNGHTFQQGSVVIFSKGGKYYCPVCGYTLRDTRSNISARRNLKRIGRGVH